MLITFEEFIHWNAFWGWFESTWMVCIEYCVEDLYCRSHTVISCQRLGVCHHPLAMTAYSSLTAYNPTPLSHSLMPKKTTPYSFPCAPFLPHCSGKALRHKSTLQDGKGSLSLLQVTVHHGWNSWSRRHEEHGLLARSLTPWQAHT